MGPSCCLLPESCSCTWGSKAFDLPCGKAARHTQDVQRQGVGHTQQTLRQTKHIPRTRTHTSYLRKVQYSSDATTTTQTLVQTTTPPRTNNQHKQQHTHTVMRTHSRLAHTTAQTPSFQNCARDVRTARCLPDWSGTRLCNERMKHSTEADSLP